jgi:hypothetical protein
MKPLARDDGLLRRLLENTDESATAAMFVQLYRESPELQHWLREDFVRDAKLRARFHREALRGRAVSVERLAAFGEESTPWRNEQRRLKAKIPGTLYGGLTWTEVVELIHEYQAGHLDLGIYLLVRQWRRAGKPVPVLRWAGFALLESILPSGRRRLLKHLHEALAFVNKYENAAKRRAVVGYGDWWKLHVLSYMLRHPSEAYAIRELRSHLVSLGLSVSTKEIRRFCTRHGIRRDMRAGRPRKSAVALAAR